MSRRRMVMFCALLVGSSLPAVAQTTKEWTTGTYVYDGAGNIKSIGSAEQYRYDALGRLTSGTIATGQTQTATYDAYGNIKTITTPESTLTIGVDAATNQAKLTLNAQTNTAYNAYGTYDDAGRLTSALNGTGGTFSYDALDSVMVSTVNGVTKVHWYTASDERIASVTMSGGSEAGSEWTLRDPSGRVLRRVQRTGTQWSWKEDYIYAGSQLLAAETDTPAQRLHFFPDHLGTPRLITANGGTKAAQHTYYPFGGEAPESSQDSEKLKFTGHERDAANLDYMHARYYAPMWGRFLSPDPAGRSADLRKPQSWNRYSYVLNNPILYVDPDGQAAAVAAPGAAGTALLAAAYVCASNPQCVQRAIAIGMAGLNILQEMQDGPPSPPIDGEVVIDGKEHPEAAQHAEDAQAAGQPSIVTIDRAGAKDRRKQATQNVPTEQNKDRDEYPPAVSKEGGSGSSIRHINPRDNRGAGASLGNQLRQYKDGAKILIKILWTLLPNI
jgi:RHS repeat-associated protein